MRIPGAVKIVDAESPSFPSMTTMPAEKKSAGSGSAAPSASAAPPRFPQPAGSSVDATSTTARNPRFFISGSPPSVIAQISFILFLQKSITAAPCGRRFARSPLAAPRPPSLRSARFCVWRGTRPQDTRRRQTSGSRPAALPAAGRQQRRRDQYNGQKPTLFHIRITSVGHSADFLHTFFAKVNHCRSLRPPLCAQPFGSSTSAQPPLCALLCMAWHTATRYAPSANVG